MTKICPECGETFDDAAHLCPYDGADLEERSAGADSHIGRVVDDRFRLDALLGRGGMGRVYEATQLSVGRQVAVKMIRLRGLDRERIKRRFFREAKVVSELSHPNIVTLLEFGEDDDLEVPYIAMEYIDGLDVRDALDDGRLHPRIVTEIASQIAAALVEAHGAGVVHRDLKTDNVLLVPVSSGGFQAKVIDFGIALPTQNSETLTNSGMICGTPKYVSPEQARNDDIDHRTDLYSLGVVIYEMATGELPFESDSALNVMMKHVREPPPSLPERLGPTRVPEKFARLVDDLLRKDPEDRPDDAQVVRRRLQSIQQDEGWATLELDTGRSMREKLQPWVLPRASSRAERPGASDLPDEVVRATAESVPPAFSAPSLGGSPPESSSADIADWDVRRSDAKSGDELAPHDTKDDAPPPQIVGVPRSGDSDDSTDAPSPKSGRSDATPSDAAEPPTPDREPPDDDPRTDHSEQKRLSNASLETETATDGRGRPRSVLAAAAVALVLSAGVAVWWWRADTASDTESTATSGSPAARSVDESGPTPTATRSEQNPEERSKQQPPPANPGARPTPADTASGAPDTGRSDTSDAARPPPETVRPDEEEREETEGAPAADSPPVADEQRPPSDDRLNEEIDAGMRWLTNE